MKNPTLAILVLFALFFSCEQNSRESQTASSQSPETAKADTTAENGGTAETILFFGNSLTAGYGVETEEAFPALIQKKLDSLGLNYRTVNAGVSGETTAGGLARIDWVLERYSPDIFVLELGANDGLRGQSVEEAEENLQKIMDRVREEYPDVRIVLAGMMIPPNYGRDYAEEFRNIYSRLAEKNDLALIPFLLDGVGGNPELNQDDGIHPTVKGHKVVAENVWQVVEPLVAGEQVVVP